MAVKKINPNDRAAIDNLNSWSLYFRGLESARDIEVPPGVKNWKRLSVAEIDAQVKSGNGFFCGTDGLGANASIKILDEDVRRYVFSLESGEQCPAQKVLDIDAVKELLAVSPKEAFEARLSELVVTDAEKKRIGSLAKEAGIENVSAYKAAAIEKISGVPLD